MTEQVILNIKGYPIKVELIKARKTSRVYHYCFGIISLRVGPKETLKKIEKKLNELFSARVVYKFNPEPFFTDNYVYVFGERTAFILKKNKPLEYDNILVENSSHKFVSLKHILMQVLQDRVAYYEKIMELSKHEIKVKKLISIVANNHIKSNILNFNEKLVHFSIPLIDEVIVHELSHDYFGNHSQKFYNKVKEFCPDYKSRREKITYGVLK